MIASRRVLVVDDEPVVVEGCHRVLTQAGYDVATAARGREGLRRAVAERFDLVVTDLKMPDMDGMELVDFLRAKQPDTAVIIITGYGTVSSAVAATKAGVADYLEKPFTPDRLADAVAHALEEDADVTAPKVNAALVHEVLRLAAGDDEFGASLLSEGSRRLSGYALGKETKAAIASGDIAWIEKRCGDISPEEREWLERRLSAEAW